MYVIMEFEMIEEGCAEEILRLVLTCLCIFTLISLRNEEGKPLIICRKAK